MQQQQRHICVPEDDDGTRLDTWVATQMDISRSNASRWIREGSVQVRGRLCTKASRAVRSGESVIIAPPPTKVMNVAAQAIPLDIAYEDDDVVVVNKPAGMVVHPAPGHADGTLVNALLHHCKGQLSGIGGVERPGIVHRIDKDTSGLIVVAKTDTAHQHLQARFASHTLERAYVAIALRTRGQGLPDQLRIETSHGRHPHDRKRFTGRPGGKRHAITNVKVLERFPSGAMLIRCELETGRTHQIRMHLAELGCPLLGDPIYGFLNPRLIKRTALHAAVLGFDLPNGREVHVESAPPEDFQSAHRALIGGTRWHK